MRHLLLVISFLFVINGCIQPSTKRRMGWPLSMFEAAPLLDGTLAGDAGFDPLRLSKDKSTLFNFREAEVKHARIAMLAALGWPVSELYHYTLSDYFGSELVTLASGDKAPSVLNGGLDNVFALSSLGTFFAVGAILEFELMRRRKEVYTRIVSTHPVYFININSPLFQPYKQIPESLQNFFDMWREDGWDTPGNYGFG